MVNLISHEISPQILTSTGTRSYDLQSTILLIIISSRYLSSMTTEKQSLLEKHGYLWSKSLSLEAGNKTCGTT